MSNPDNHRFGNLKLLFFIFFASDLMFLCDSNVLPQKSQWQGCINEMGEEVDSFIMYKLPRDYHSEIENIRNGVAYMNLKTEESSHQEFAWKLSNYSIADQNSAPGRTLKSLYGNFEQEDALWIAYNDEWPNGKTSFTHGHSKGVVKFTRNGGFWLVHSTPKYPPDSTDGGSYGYPRTGHRYGQSFMCVSLPPSQADNLGTQLLQHFPYIYLGKISDGIKGEFPMLEKVIDGGKPVEGNSRISELVSSGGEIYKVFSKFTTFGKDLYSDLVAPSLKTSLFVETWRNGANPMPSSCNSSDFRVENINEIDVPTANLNFSTHRDHSKWAVSESITAPWSCIGDINRMESQRHRAGGTLCTRSTGIWYQFYGLIGAVDLCPL